MSADNVGIKFDSALTIRVIDPAKAVTMLGIATKTATRQSASSKNNCTPPCFFFFDIFLIFLFFF